MSYKQPFRINTKGGIRNKDTADFSFVFSDDITKWQRKRTMSQEARFVARKKRQEKQ